MISEEEFLRRDVKSAISNTVRTLFRTREFSKNFLGRKDSRSIDKEIDSIAEGVADIIIQRLKSKGKLGKTLSEEQFSEIYALALKEYFGGNTDRGRIRPE